MSASGRTKLTPAEVADQYGCDVNKVLRWISNGELRAINIAQRLGGRPRWRIDVDDLKAFEARRSSTANTTPDVPRRKRPARPAGFVEYV